MSANLGALVASPHFVWMVGMVEREAGAVCVQTLDGEPWLWAVDGCLTEAEDDDARPDLDHAGTRGCLLHLVREAWGGLAEVTLHSDDTVTVDIELTETWHGFNDLGAALLAAPPKGGG